MTLLKDFKAVKEGNVWCLTKSMFQETTCLGDVIMDIHRMLTEDDPEGPHLPVSIGVIWKKEEKSVIFFHL